MSPPARTSASSRRNSVGVSGQRRSRRRAPRGGRAPGPARPRSAGRRRSLPGPPARSTRRMTALIRASSSALPNGLVR